MQTLSDIHGVPGRQRHASIAQTRRIPGVFNQLIFAGMAASPGSVCPSFAADTVSGRERSPPEPGVRHNRGKARAVVKRAPDGHPA